MKDHITGLIRNKIINENILGVQTLEGAVNLVPFASYCLLWRSPMKLWKMSVSLNVQTKIPIDFSHQVPSLGIRLNNKYETEDMSEYLKNVKHFQVVSIECRLPFAAVRSERVQPFSIIKLSAQGTWFNVMLDSFNKLWANDPIKFLSRHIIISHCLTARVLEAQCAESTAFLRILLQS